jgi:hypothetical protein
MPGLKILEPKMLLSLKEDTSLKVLHAACFSWSLSWLTL